MKRVLIVDDLKGIQTMLSVCLRAEGFETCVCGDGKTAMELTLREKFDLVFLDIRLPLASGTEVLKKMREAGVMTPVVVITAHPNIGNAIECTRLGAAAYVRKPFTANRILGILDDLGVRREARVRARIRQAQELFERRRYEEVEKFLRNMVPDDIFNPEIYRMLAEISSRQNKARESEQYYKLYQAIR